LDWSFCRYSDVHLPVKDNEDNPLIKAILKKNYIEQSKQDKTIFDHDFIKTIYDGSPTY